MALIPVITRAKFESIEDDLKKLYKPVGDTFQLDIDETTLGEHISIKDKNSPLIDELSLLKLKHEEATLLLEKSQLDVNEYKLNTNKRTIVDTLADLTNSLDLSGGRKELLDRLMEPKINGLLEQAATNELDTKVITKELNAELTLLKRISASTFVDKKDDTGGIRYEKQKGTITKDTNIKEDEKSDDVDYDNYKGSLNDIDYDHYITNYFTKD